MSEIQNHFLEAIDINSEKQQDITENEWTKINNDKDKILSKISNSQIKAQFELKYQKLDEYFKQEWEQIHKTTWDELSFLKEAFKSDIKTNDVVKNELILKYSTEYKWLQSDVIRFINSSFNNSLNDELWDFNISKFDKKDNREWFSEYELEEYTAILDKAMSNMNILWWYAQFKDKCREVWEDPSFLSWKWDIAVANAIDLQEHVFWEWKKHIIDNIVDYSEEKLSKMRDEKFDITDSNKMKNFFVLLGLEFWEWVEDILRFIWNIGSWVVLLPRYTNNRITLSDWNIDTKNEVDAQMENDMLLEGNPSLMLWELLWEKWIQLIKQLWEMMVSWKNWDIALLLVTIAWLIAWWAGAVKLWARFARKQAVMSARKAGRLWRTNSWRLARNKVRDWANQAWKVQRKFDKIDDIVWWAWIWHMTWAFSWVWVWDKMIDSSSPEPETLYIRKSKKQLEQQAEEMKILMNDKNYVGDKSKLYTDIMNIQDEIKLIFPHSHLILKSISEMKLELRQLDSTNRKIRVKEIRDVVEYSQRVWLEVVRLIEKSLDETLSNNMSRNDFNKTESYKQALAITNPLPSEYRKIILEKIEKFTSDTKLRAELENLSSKEIIQKIFGYTPEHDIDVKIWSVSTEINVYNDDDFLHIDWKDSITDNWSFGFAKKMENGHVAVSRDVTDTTIINHEVQHARFSAIIPKKKPYPSKWMKTWKDINKLLYSENLDKVIIEILKPELNNALDWVKDEALAYTKNWYSDADVLLLKWESALYDYTYKIRKSIKDILITRPDISSLIGNIDNLDDAIDNLFMEDYLRVSKNIINTARMNSDKLDLLTITPYNQWWRLSELVWVWSRSDYTLNLARL